MHRRVVLGLLASLSVLAVALWIAAFVRSAGTEAASPSAGDVRAERPAASASSSPSARTASAAPPESTAVDGTEGDGTEGDASEDEPPQVELASTFLSGAVYETVPVRGVLRDAEAATTLRLQKRVDGRWRSFPLPTTTGADGRFTAYVELPAAGNYKLRVLDPRTGETSPIATLLIS